MAEINVNVTEVNNAILKLKELQERYDSIKYNAPDTVGGGQTVNELESIANEYKEITANLKELVSDTISFLVNVRDSYISSDAKAREMIEGK